MGDALITLTTHDGGHRGLDRFLESCRRVGVVPVRLGMRERFHGMMMKPKRLHAYLATHPEVARFLWLDAYDGVLQRPLADAFAEFEGFGAPVVFSAERNVWPDEALRDLLPEAPTPYRGICAGAWMATRDAAMALVEESGMLGLADHDPGTDQLATYRWLLAHPGQYAIDYHCRVFGSLCRSEGDYEYGPGRVVHRLTGTTPAAIHGNGRADMGPACAALGL